MTLPLDNGYLRRECPECQRQFKWHSGPTDDRPADAVDPVVYTCPYCGTAAPPDQWWTPDQLEYAHGLASIEATKILGGEMEELGRQTRGSFVQLKVSGTDVGEPPTPLHEPDDMVVVQSPCHPWEPVKIDENWHDPLRCIVCGEKFAT
jgi:endogenous inhibitor of DNA gyrase (YacG/DUF329 family)